LKITKLEISEFLKIKQLKLDRFGKFNFVKGGNEVGKSSFVKAIKAAFESEGVDPSLIHHGADAAEIVVELDDYIKIRRRMTPTANTLDVKINGAVKSKPQAFLNDLIAGGISQFNPVRFFLSDAAIRRKVIMSAIDFKLTPEDIRKFVEKPDDPGLNLLPDIGDLDYEQHGLDLLAEVQKLAYDQRRDRNADVDRQKKFIQQSQANLPAVGDLSKYDGFDLNVKLQELQKASDTITAHNLDLSNLHRLRGTRDDLLSRKTKIEAQIDQLTQELTDTDNKIAEVKKQGIALLEKTEAYRAPAIETIKKDIENFREAQKIANQLEAIKTSQGELDQLIGQAKELDDLYKALTTDIPKKLMADMEMPVKGMTIEGDEILFNGASLDNLSGKQQIEFALSLARALSKEMKVICIDGFEALSEGNRRAFEAEAAEDGFEYIITQVTDGELAIEAKDAPVKQPETQHVPAPPSSKTVKRKALKDF